MAGGSKLACVCICGDCASEALELHVPQLFRPVSLLWPAVRVLASAGEPLFFGWTGQKVLAEIREFADPEERRRASRLGTHPFRRGAARAIFEAGG